MSGTITLSYGKDSIIFSNIDLNSFIIPNSKIPIDLTFSNLTNDDKQGCIWTFLTNNAKYLMNLSEINFDKRIHENVHIQQFYKTIKEKNMTYEMSNHNSAHFTVCAEGISRNPSTFERPTLKKLLSGK
jgi:hypothetical protein